MVGYHFVAGFYAVAVLAAPAQQATQAAAAPAGWSDGLSLGSVVFGWPKPNHNKPDEEEARPAPIYASPTAGTGTRDWGSLLGGVGGGRGDKTSSSSGQGAGTGASRDWGSFLVGGKGGDSNAPPRGASGGLLSGLFSGGVGKPKPASSDSTKGSAWGSWGRPSSKPKPEWKPNPDPGEASWTGKSEPKPESAQPKPDSAEPKPDQKPEVAVPPPAPSAAEPKPESAAPKIEPKPESKPETAAPEPAKESKPEPKPESKPQVDSTPKPATESSEPSASAVSSESQNVCGAKRPASGDIEQIRTKLWQPKIGSKWQIILDGVPDTKQKSLQPLDANVWDVDLWDATAEDICRLKKQGKKVICYFSAGTSETWRHDNDRLKPFNKGPVQMDDSPGGKVWEGESWLDIRESTVRTVMSERIKMAADKGCDAVDPDNMDGYDNVIKSSKNAAAFKLSENDAVKYMKFLADESAKYGMSIGLKNSLTIIPKVKPYIQFAVNEECAKVKECQEYKELLKVQKPVFHIEYTTTQGSNKAITKTTYKDPNGATKKYCNPLRESVSRFSTIIKAGETLSNQYLYCDGKPAGFTAMDKYTDKKTGRSKSNVVDNDNDNDNEEEKEKDDDEESQVVARERFTTNGTMVLEQGGSNATTIPTWRVKKRRHHKLAVLVESW